MVHIADPELKAAFDGLDPAEVFRTSAATLAGGEGPAGRLPPRRGRRRRRRAAAGRRPQVRPLLARAAGSAPARHALRALRGSGGDLGHAGGMTRIPRLALLAYALAIVVIVGRPGAEVLGARRLSACPSGFRSWPPRWDRPAVDHGLRTVSPDAGRQPRRQLRLPERRGADWTRWALTALLAGRRRPRWRCGPGGWTGRCWRSRSA